MGPGGIVFEVKRFGVHDGPGVRTVLFLKGCSLRCRWCHNPEGIESRPQLAYYEHKCLHCGECVEACPHGAHSFTDGKHVFDRTGCVACGACVEACLGRALKLFGRPLTVEEACRVVLEDRSFYEQSGGGCTVSGGEPLLQAEFCADLFERLHKEGIHCAVDTSGAVPWEAFELVLPHTDLFLYDLKHTDDEKHRAEVGRSNRRVLDNLARLATCDVPIEIRIPTIPGSNADTASMSAMGEFLQRLPNIVAVRLLPYHPAQSKHEAFGRPDTMPQVAVPAHEQMNALATCLAEFGLPVKCP